MADAPPTRLHIDPPIGQWRVTPRNERAKPVIATGHQPYLWHPGILAKYFAADALAKRVGGRTLDVAVAHNPHPAHRLDVPQQHGDVLRVHRCRLSDAGSADDLPLNVAPPMRADPAIDRLEDEQSFAAMSAAWFISTGLADLAEAFADSDRSANRAEQMLLVRDRLLHPYLQNALSSQSTGEVVTPSFVDRLLSDPVACVRAYNRAAIAYPEAGIRTLYVGRDVIEAPLWAQDVTTCTPVYIDLGDSKRPQLFTTAHNRHLDLTEPGSLTFLRPRAVTLSAIMRSELCDFFIHGTGGGVYDQVTERWWHDWVGDDLAPMAVVSADAYLPFDVPTATGEQLAKAQWLAHHLPHNVDRYTPAADHEEQVLRSEKRALLDRMNDDRDKRRRAKAFQRIHAINETLTNRHREIMNKAIQGKELARLGLNNAAIAGRRDGCFALYPHESIDTLRRMIIRK